MKPLDKLREMVAFHTQMGIPDSHPVCGSPTGGPMTVGDFKELLALLTAVPPEQP